MKISKYAVAVATFLLSSAVLAQATIPAQVIWENKPEPRGKAAFVTTERYTQMADGARSAYVAGVLDAIELIGPDQNARLIHECLRGANGDVVRAAVDEYVRSNPVGKIGNIMSQNVNNALVGFCQQYGLVAH